MSVEFVEDTVGDAVFSIHCAFGHNLRKIFAQLRTPSALLLPALLTTLGRPEPCHIEPRHGSSVTT